MALTFLKLLFRKLKKLLIILFIGQFAYIILLKWVDPPITITQFTNWVEGHGLKRDYIDYDEMSPNIKMAVMASEDQLFPDHNGFAVESIKKAWSEKNKKLNKCYLKSKFLMS